MDYNTSILALVGGSGWYQEYNKNMKEAQAANERLIIDSLAPIDSLLQSNKEIHRELSSDEYSEPNWGILESYLIKIRRDGVKPHSLMKQRIDTLVKNNQAIITLLQKYTGYAKTEAFKTQSRNFINHATLYNDRWASLIEVYESKADFPTAAPVFPAEFPVALQLEIKTVQSNHT